MCVPRRSGATARPRADNLKLVPKHLSRAHAPHRSTNASSQRRSIAGDRGGCWKWPCYEDETRVNRLAAASSHSRGLLPGPDVSPCVSKRGLGGDRLDRGENPLGREYVYVCTCRMKRPRTTHSANETLSPDPSEKTIWIAIWLLL